MGDVMVPRASVMPARHDPGAADIPPTDGAAAAPQSLLALVLPQRPMHVLRYHPSGPRGTDHDRQLLDY